VLEPDLAAVPLQRWPVFTPAALELDVRAVFAVPLQIGAIRIGVLLAHRDGPGPLTDGTLTDLLVFARPRPTRCWVLPSAYRSRNGWPASHRVPG
jgi:hypothetical protein